MDHDSIDFWETLQNKVGVARTIQMRSYDQIIIDLKQALCSDFPNKPIYTLGSRIMGLADADSDLDICISFLDMYWTLSRAGTVSRTQADCLGTNIILKRFINGIPNNVY